MSYIYGSSGATNPSPPSALDAPPRVTETAHSIWAESKSQARNSSHGTQVEPEAQSLQTRKRTGEDAISYVPGSSRQSCQPNLGLAQFLEAMWLIKWLQHRTWPKTAGHAPPIPALWQALGQKAGSELGLPDLGPCYRRREGWWSPGSL